MRIVIADPQTRVRSALRVLLEQHLRLEVLGEAGTAEELLGLMRAACPELLLLDWDLPGAEPAELLRSVRGQCPAVMVIVISGRTEARPLALAAGAQAFVSKGAAPEGLISAVQAYCAPNPGAALTAAAQEVKHGSEIPSASLRSEDDTGSKPVGAVSERPGR